MCYQINYLEILIQIPVIIVKSDETLSTAAECDLIATVVPPVVEACTTGNVPESNHLEDLAPAVFAYPTVAA